MAEAVAGERTSPPTRFYCHMCNLEINIFNNDYTCPLCSDGFIEELPPLTASAADSGNSPGASSSGTSGSHSSIDPQSDSPSNRINDLVTSLLLSRGGLSPMLNNIGGPQELEISIDATGGGGGSGSETGSGNRSGGTARRHSVVGGSGTGSNIGGGRQRQPNFQRLDNVFLEFLSSLSSGEDGVFGNSQMFFMGNPGDYAWGREGIDTVVTQLLNHIDTSGPPPLPKDKIAEIPTVEITETEVDQKLKCSVCWEDFKLQEAVRKLPCLHVYHENCIVPWLDLHGTCPICRKSLQLEPSTGCSMHNGAASTSVNSDMSLPTVSVSVTSSQPGGASSAAANSNANNQSQPMDTSSASAATTRPQAAQALSSSSSPAAARTSQQSPNVLAFEDGNVEYDVD